MLPKRDFIDQLLYSLPDGVLVAIEWLTKLILVLLFFSLPVALASLDELMATEGVHPRPDCVGIVAADEGAAWHQAACFGADFLAQWGDQFVVFLSPVPVNCEPVSGDQAEQECHDRERGRTEKVVKHLLLFGAGVAIGGEFGGR